MKRLTFAAAVLTLATSLSAADIKATTSDGKQVILHSDGTWAWVTAASASTDKPAAATETLVSRKKFYTLAYDPTKWKPGKASKNDDAEFFLEHESGDVYGMTIAERLGMTIEALRDLVISNAKNAAPDIKVVSEQHRKVNGADMLIMRMEGTASGIPITYYGYYWTGEAGTLQVVTFTGKNLFAEYEKDMAELLNGVQLK